MSVTALSGAITTFPQGVNSGEPSGQNPQAGPVFGHHGLALLDMRAPFTYQPGSAPGKSFYGFSSTDVVAIDATPSALAANNIAASQSPGAGAITLVSSSGAGITTGVSITNASTGATVTGLLAIDSKTGGVAFGTDGTVNIWDPSTLIARAVRIVSGGNDSGITFTVNGYDIYGYPMTETITGANIGTATGAKAWKYISSVTHTGTVAGTITIGTTDIFGFPIRVDKFAYLDLNWNNTVITANTGFTAAVTSTATATTGDVRGTYNVQSASDGTKQLQAFISLNPTNLKTASGVFGVTQF